MKKYISMLIWVFLITFTSVSYAGSVPEDIIDDDNANLYIGTLESFSYVSISSSPYVKITSMTITPTQKLKGDIETNKTLTYDNCNFYMQLQKGEEYLFVDFTHTNGSAAIYAYEIISNFDNKISLAESQLYEQTRRLEEYINDGTLARAEKERATLGSVISLDEFLKLKSISERKAQYVIFTYKGDRYDIPLDTFFNLASQIKVTNVKDSPVQNYGNEGAFDSVLYIELRDDVSQEISCAAVTELGEVSANSPYMSMLPSKDYIMDISDLSKLQKLLSDNSTSILPRLNNEYSSQIEYNLKFDALTAIATVICVIILSSAVYIFKKR